MRRHLLCLVTALGALSLGALPRLLSELPLCAVQGSWSFENRCLPGHRNAWADGGLVAPRRRIAVLLVLDDFLPEEARAATVHNKLQYCLARGYALVVPPLARVREAAAGSPVPWAKFPLARDVLDEGYEYVLVIDADAMIMRADVSLDLAADELEREGRQLLISTDFNGLNSGVFLLRAGRWADDFLEAAWGSRALLSPMRHIPLRYENRAFFYVTDMWPSCWHLTRADALLAPRYPDPAAAARFRDGLLLADRCDLNARPRYGTAWHQAFGSGTSFDDTADAFVVHAAGIRAKDDIVRRLAAEAYT
jgi:hypothetical protein